MKAIVTMMLVSLSLVACSVSTTAFKAPMGKKGYTITCKDGKDCYKEARSKCPEGYTNVRSPSGEQTEQGGNRLVIECN